MPDSGRDSDRHDHKRWIAHRQPRAAMCVCGRGCGCVRVCVVFYYAVILFKGDIRRDIKQSPKVTSGFLFRLHIPPRCVGGFACMFFFVLTFCLVHFPNLLIFYLFIFMICCALRSSNLLRACLGVF